MSCCRRVLYHRIILRLPRRSRRGGPRTHNAKFKVLIWTDSHKQSGSTGFVHQLRKFGGDFKNLKLEAHGLQEERLDILILDAGSVWSDC